MDTIAYTTSGPVRGTCGHTHATEEAAQACADRDNRGCAAGGGYSDRAVEALDLDEVLDLPRIPWVLIDAAGHDIGGIARDALAYGDKSLYRRATRAAARLA